ncbi:hypothetical protein GCM10012279_38260 [Micromonospora yangpuensis]|nr:hypothetical protein GCM10012279_38260 [Micromonospora yangpuensis]
MIPSRRSTDLLGGHWTLISGWGRVPKALVWDNESAVGQWRAGRPQLTEAMNAFRGTLGIKVIRCRPADPESKGLVERANGYLETSFLPGRRFASPQDFNAQLTDWLVRANHRQHRMRGCRPLDRWDADRAAMLSLPPVAPVVGWRQTTRLPRDHYVRLDSNDYSVHPAAVGRRVTIVADADRVQVFCEDRQVAWHDRCWAKASEHHRSRSPPSRRRSADSGPAGASAGSHDRGGAPPAGRLRPPVRPGCRGGRRRSIG